MYTWLILKNGRNVTERQDEGWPVVCRYYSKLCFSLKVTTTSRLTFIIISDHEGRFIISFGD